MSLDAFLSINQIFVLNLMFQPAVIMSRLTTACCMECKELGVIPETDEEYLSDEEAESSVSHVGESIQSKTSKGGTSKSLWQKGIKWVVKVSESELVIYLTLLDLYSLRIST